MYGALLSDWLLHPVVVEEKLDGANVSIWWERSQLRVASRGGSDAMDRGRQLGPLRSRVNAGYGQLQPLLENGLVLYAEWLWLTHTVRYDQLIDHLVVLDFCRPDEGFVELHERDRLSRAHELVVPPRLFDGVLGSKDALVKLMGRSRLGSELMEGAVLRRDDGQRCKVLRPGFVRAGDTNIGRRRNVLAPLP
ncbi:MAG: RNA ligase family protein [Actinomycetota bacterium]|nr:RNA ligase family protein [Actinomycetota bacterium]